MALVAHEKRQAKGLLSFSHYVRYAEYYVELSAGAQWVASTLTHKAFPLKRGRNHVRTLFGCALGWKHYISLSLLCYAAFSINSASPLFGSAPSL